MLSCHRHRVRIEPAHLVCMLDSCLVREQLHHRLDECFGAADRVGVGLQCGHNLGRIDARGLLNDGSRLLTVSAACPSPSQKSNHHQAFGRRKSSLHSASVRSAKFLKDSGEGPE